MLLYTRASTHRHGFVVGGTRLQFPARAALKTLRCVMAICFVRARRRRLAMNRGIAMSPIKSEYVEQRNGGYYLAGSRVSLDTVLHAFLRGEAPETILQHFPAINSLAKVYGAIAFALDHPQEMDAYLAEQEQHWEEARRTNPPAIVEKVRRARHEGTVRST